MKKFILSLMAFCLLATPVQAQNCQCGTPDKDGQSLETRVGTLEENVQELRQVLIQVIMFLKDNTEPQSTPQTDRN